MSLKLLPRSDADWLGRVFWNASAAEGADLAPEDPLALDYLGQQVGYWLFGAFTTRTSRAQYFPIVLYGLELAGSHPPAALPPTDAERVARFERWERFWALSVLQFNGGPLPRRHEDAFRGVRGANHAWSDSGGRLPLDFTLISRQSELGALGAYLSALRDTGLVHPGTLRPSPAAEEILASFWDERGAGARTNSYKTYSQRAVEGDDAVPRNFGGVTLRAIGERSRLSSLVARQRREQQDRLWEALFVRARDDTLELAGLLREASSRRTGPPSPREFLERAVDQTRPSKSSDRVRSKLEFALRFGEAARQLLGQFDAMYRSVSERGWAAPADAVARDTFGSTTLAPFRSALRAVLDHQLSVEMQRLPMHGQRALSLFDQVQTGTAGEVMRLLLDYHDAVQKDRQRGAGWIRIEGGDLVLSVTSYRGHEKAARFPTFKLDVVQSLLRDLGRLS